MTDRATAPCLWCDQPVRESEQLCRPCVVLLESLTIDERRLIRQCAEFVKGNAESITITKPKPEAPK